MKRRFAGCVVGLILALPAGAEEPKDEFRQTAIPPEVPAAFACWQGGAETLRHEGVVSFAPAKVQGVMTFSLGLKGGRTILLYLGAETTCALEVGAPG